MRWIALDAALVLVVLTALAAVLLRVWRTLRGLARQVGRAGDLVASATAELATLQAPSLPARRRVGS